LSLVPTAGTQYGANNRLEKQPNEVPLPGTPYDAAGNLISHPVMGSMSYDGENRLVAMTNVGTPPQSSLYAYDGEGRRVKRTVGSDTTVYLYDAFGRLAAEAGVAETAATRYLTKDHLGSTRLVTDQTGTIATCYDYLPFGEALTAGRPTCFQSAGFYQQYPPADKQAVRFTGKERDAESGLDYFGARYMSAAMGRFTSADAPFADQFAENPQSWNLYSYTRNNPIRYVDDDGRGVKEFWLGITNAVNSNNAFGFGRLRATHPHERLGQRVGDAISVLQSGVEMALGGGIAGGGAAACAGTGVGCLITAPAVTGGSAMMLHGASVMGNAMSNTLMSQGNDDGPSGSGSSEPLVGQNPREAKGRTNTDLKGGHSAASEKFAEITKGQSVVVDPKSGHRVAADGTRLRLNPDGTARVDIPKSGNRPKHETIHFNDPDKLKQP